MELSAAIRGVSDPAANRTVFDLAKHLNLNKNLSCTLLSILPHIINWRLQEAETTIPRVLALQQAPFITVSDASYERETGEAMLGGFTIGPNGQVLKKWAFGATVPVRYRRLSEIAVLEFIAALITITLIPKDARVFIIIDSQVAVSMLKRVRSHSEELRRLSLLCSKYIPSTSRDVRYIPSALNIADVLTRLTRKRPLFLEKAETIQIQKDIFLQIAKDISELPGGEDAPEAAQLSAALYIQGENKPL